MIALIKRYVPVLIVMMCVLPLSKVRAQDSLLHKYDSLAKIRIKQTDSTSGNINNRIDAFQERLNNLLNPNLSRLTQNTNKHISNIPDSLKDKIDSLKRLNLSPIIYQRKIDSVMHIAQLKQVGDKLNRPINNMNDKLGLIRQQTGDGGNVPGDIERIKTDANLDTSFKLPAVKKSSEIKDLSLENPLNKIQNNDNIQSVKAPLQDVNDVTDKVQLYGDDLKSASSGDLSKSMELPKSGEQQLMKIDEIKELQKQAAEGDKLKGMTNIDAKSLVNSNELQLPVEAAFDHFTGKEQILTQAMDKMSKMTEKYSDLTSVVDFSKRPSNPLKGKPFVERLVPGVTLQVLRVRNYMIDVSPSIGYRFTKRLSVGAGWNERISFNKWNKLNSSDRIFGPRVFSTFIIKNGFGIRAETEKLNTLVPSVNLGDSDLRQWIWSLFVGFKKEYQICQWLNGNAQLLYNLFDDHNNSPYADRLNVRVGFEFPVKQKISQKK